MSVSKQKAQNLNSEAKGLYMFQALFDQNDKEFHEMVQCMVLPSVR